LANQLVASVLKPRSLVAIEAPPVISCIPLTRSFTFKKACLHGVYHPQAEARLHRTEVSWRLLRTASQQKPRKYQQKPRK
jgi:hypothetical protein